MSFVKYRLKEVATDFGTTPKAIADIISRYYDKPKSNTQVLTDPELNAVFGGMEYDLRNAIFEKDCAIKATAVFGGIDILVPDHVKVVVNSTGLFGGTSNKAKSLGNTVTLYVRATSLFGGVDIK